MDKIDSNTIIKNLTGILCGTIIISLLFPFVSIGASANAGGMGEAEESTVLNGFQIITDGGFLGILLIVCPIAILIANYLPQLQKYKKIVSLALSVVGIVMMFLVSGNISAGANAGGEAVGQMTGAASAFLSITDSKVIMNCPRWCAVLAERELATAVKEYEERLFCSEVLEPDLLYGVSDKLQLAVEEACADQKKSFLAVLTSCSLSLIGDDIQGVCKSITANCPVIALDAGGLSGEYWQGWSNALTALLSDMKLQQTMPEAATVNIIGCSTCHPNWEGDMLELYRMLNSIGIKVNLCLLTNGTQLQELQKIGQAALNVVINKELGKPVAEWLFKNLNQQYIIADIPYGFTASINWLKKIATALKIETNIEALEHEIAAARENIFDSFSALCDIDNSWSLKRLVISAGSSCAHSLAAVIKKDLSMVEQCFVRINGPNEENRNCNYQRWQYAGDLPKLNENEYQILCGTDRERSEIGNISQTIYINSVMPAEKISVTSATYAGIRGWTHFMQTVFRQLRLFIYLKKESI